MSTFGHFLFFLLLFFFFFNIPDCETEFLFGFVLLCKLVPNVHCTGETSAIVKTVTLLKAVRFSVTKNAVIICGFVFALCQFHILSLSIILLIMSCRKV